MRGAFAEIDTDLICFWGEKMEVSSYLCYFVSVQMYSQYYFELVIIGLVQSN